MFLSLSLSLLPPLSHGYTRTSFFHQLSRSIPLWPDIIIDPKPINANRLHPSTDRRLSTIARNITRRLTTISHLRIKRKAAVTSVHVSVRRIAQILQQKNKKKKNSLPARFDAEIPIALAVIGAPLRAKRRVAKPGVTLERQARRGGIAAEIVPIVGQVVGDAGVGLGGVDLFLEGAVGGVKEDAGGGSRAWVARYQLPKRILLV